MKQLLPLLFFIFSLSLCADWNQWRGSHDGEGNIVKQNIVTEWGPNKNILWQSKVPGKGHSSPIVAAGKVYLTTADKSKKTQSVLCYDQKTGKKLWEQQAYKGEFIKLHKQNSHASPTPVSDGNIVVCSFGINKTNMLIAYDHKGKKLWDKRLSPFDSQFGIGSSPMLYKGLIYIVQDNAPQSFIATYDIKTGKEGWKIKRNLSKKNSYSTLRVLNYKGKETLLVNSFYKLEAYNPQTGKLLWDTKGAVHTTVGTPVLLNDTLFCSGGYPERITMAYQLSPKPKLLWKNKFATYIASVVEVGGYLYAGNKKGEIACIA
ncbi:MAG: PQQ-binding-like beta-propeller repeat protein, partial [Planctomycetes bacterium]|nr:PQQ-binding-like beta-propeller repeat protein [Planctomycetota bacterium]